jgi:aromatic ring-opening dioxygenase LigB subunit
MPILKSLVLPHGSNILDPENFPSYPGCQTLHDKALEGSKTFNQTQYDLIFLVTPHGHALSKSYCFYLNSSGTGNVDDTKQYAPYTASLDIDTVTTQSLMKHLGNECPKTAIESLVSYGDDMKIPLKWAEVIPVWFLNQFPSKAQPKFVIFSLPHKRLTEGDQMVSEAYLLGKSIYEFLNNSPLKIAVLISCDLAHTHKIPGGPEAGTEPYGISEMAEPFDEAIEKWARNPVAHSGMESLLIDAKGMLMKALSCGYLGLVMLAAGLKTHVLKGGKIESEVFVRLHPTYFGMMVARFDLL